MIFDIDILYCLLLTVCVFFSVFFLFINERKDKSKSQKETKTLKSF